MDATALIEPKTIIPVVEIQESNLAPMLAKTLRDAGIKAIEITLRTSGALDAIEMIASEVPDITVGAGSVRFAEQIESISRRGARFAVSPGASLPLLEAAANCQMPFVPGAATPSEMIALMEHGYCLQKFFPAELSGGVAKIKAISSPLPEIRFFPTGGISAELASDYLSTDCVYCIGGSWIVSQELLAEKRFEEIGRLATEAVRICNV